MCSVLYTLFQPRKHLSCNKLSWGKVRVVWEKYPGNLLLVYLNSSLGWSLEEVSHLLPLSHLHHPWLFIHKANEILTHSFGKENYKCYVIDDGPGKSPLKKTASFINKNIWKAIWQVYMLKYIINLVVSHFSLFASKCLDMFLLGGGRKTRGLICCQKKWISFLFSYVLGSGCTSLYLGIGSVARFPIWAF